MKKEMNKKGAEMAIGTIIVIILALVVLVFLIMGFSRGWGNLWQSITNIGGGESNVQTIVSACNIACSTNAQFDYCKPRDVKFGDDNDGKYNCKALEGKNVGLTCNAEFDCLPISPGCVSIVKEVTCDQHLTKEACNGDTSTTDSGEKLCKWY